ncbi:galacturonosyltransferase 14 [Carex rostrata]
MQLRISPSMRSITISNGFVDSMKLRVGPAPPLLPHQPPHHTSASSAFSYRSFFYFVLFCACLLPFVFIRTALVTLEGLECSSLDCFKRHIGPSIFGKSNGNSKKLVKELYEVLHKVDKEDATISENLPDTFHEFMSEMKNHKYDARTFAVRLKATMENMNKEIKKSRLSEQLFKHYAASAVPRGIHCLSLRLTDEYSSNAHARKQLPSPELLPILSDNSYYHLVLATDNILAASVVVSSAIQSSENAERLVFHIITDKKTYPGMHSWFALNPISPAIIEVKSVHQYGWLTRENVPVLEAMENHNFVRSHYHGNRASAISGGDNPRAFASKLQARSPMYISLLNHLRIFLPELFPNLDKVLFLDDDVVIQHDLSPLWEIDLQGKVMGAVETCRGDDKWVMSKRFRTYFNFSHPLIVANLDPDECPWAFGMNIFDLSAWRKTNIRETFHYWVKENIKSGLTLWKFGTLPPALIAFRGHVYPIDPAWHMLGLGYQENSKLDNVREAAVIHYNGQCKPWLDIGFKHLKPFWMKHVNHSNDFIRNCHILEPL